MKKQKKTSSDKKKIKIQRGKYLIFGGTGSLGKTLVSRLLAEKCDVVVFSRDEAKHYALRLEYPTVETIIGDIRDYESVVRAIRRAQPTHVINAAAMKQIPLSEQHPYEAVQTNVIGVHNVVHAVADYARSAKKVPLKVVMISTDKACKPVGSYGMSKALGERISLNANEPGFVVHTAVRYGNVLESTGSVIPVFKNRIARDLPLYVTHPEMTRFLLSLNQAVDLVFKAFEDKEGGRIYIPKVPASRIIDLADVMIEHSGKKIQREITGIRPGEKLHEILISEEELWRTEDRGDVYIVDNPHSKKMLSEVTQEFSSKTFLFSPKELTEFLKKHNVF